jgi:hypothetical protein
MWDLLFAITAVVSICLIVAAFLMRDRGSQQTHSQQTQMTGLSSGNASFRIRPARANLKKLLAKRGPRMAMRADLVDQRKVSAEPNATSLGHQENTSEVSNSADRRLPNMSEMMAQLGLDAQDLNVGSVLRACQSCRADEVCHDWLARAPKSLKQAPSFCPNANRFAHARQMLG